MAFSTSVTRVLVTLHVVRYGADTLEANPVPTNSLATFPALLPIQQIKALPSFTSRNELAAYRRLTSRSAGKGASRSPPTPEKPETLFNGQPSSMEYSRTLASTEANINSPTTRATQTFEVPPCQSISLIGNEDPPTGLLQWSNVRGSDSIVTEKQLSTPSRKLSRFFMAGEISSPKTPFVH